MSGRVRGWLSALLRRSRFERDMTDELRAHLELRVDALVASGLTPDEARRQARVEFGSVEAYKDRMRDARRLTWLDDLRRDLRYAMRTLAGQPGFTAMALLALVLGIGLNTSLFTAINAVWSRPWNVPEPDRVVTMFPVTQRGPVSGFALTAARFLNEHSRTIEGALAFRTTRLELDGTAGGPGVNASFVTGNFFDVLHVGMAAGRPFTGEDDEVASPAAVAVISRFLWTGRYAASRAILGRTIRLDGVPFTVIGVAAESFTGVTADRTDVWVPFASIQLLRADDPNAVSLLTDPGRCCSDVAARLRPGVSRAQAQAELNALFQQYLTDVNRVPPAEFRLSRAPADIVLAGTAILDNPEARRRVAPVLAVLLAAFGSILLLACANVSNLLLARAAARQREFAVRVAIGAGRWRIIRQLLAESLVLAAVASAVALLLAFVLPDLIVRFVGQTRPTNLSLMPDANVLAYAVGITVVSALVFGLAPALRGTRISVSDAMKRQSAHATPRIPLRGTLLGVQVAISVALLMAAGLLVRGLDRARSLDLGFRTEGVTAVQVTLPANAYDPASEQAFFDTLVARLDSGGRTAGVSLVVPLSGRREYTGLGAVCAGQGLLLQQWVTGGYFDVLQIPVVAGRNFFPEDRGRRSMLVNETLANVCWPERSPVGLVVNDGQAEIVGVVRDAQIAGIGAVPPTFFAQYVPDGGLVGSPAVVLLPSAMASTAVAAVRDMDPGAATEEILLSEQVDRSLGTTAGVARMAGTLGLLALLLATVGVYGVISYSVEQRRRELGVRMALGARPSQVVGLVLRRNARAVAAGLVVGMATAAGESVVLKSQLYGLSPIDPLAYAGVLALLLVAGVAASAMPALRAARTDAVTALHYE